MRIATILAPSILGIVIAAWPGAALAVQIVGVALAVAPAFGPALRARAGKSHALPAAADPAGGAGPSSSGGGARREV